MYIRKGISLDKAKVGWEIRWYSGNTSLKVKDFASAVSYFTDAEALLTYEGTYQMQNLILGKAITGFSAFV